MKHLPLDPRIQKEASFFSLINNNNSFHFIRCSICIYKTYFQLDAAYVFKNKYQRTKSKF